MIDDVCLLVDDFGVAMKEDHHRRGVLGAGRVDGEEPGHNSSAAIDTQLEHFSRRAERRGVLGWNEGAAGGLVGT